MEEEERRRPRHRIWWVRELGVLERCLGVVVLTCSLSCFGLFGRNIPPSCLLRAKLAPVHENKTVEKNAREK